MKAEAAEMLAAEAGDGSEFIKRPRAREVGFHALPDAPEPVVSGVGLGETQDVVVDEFAPMVEGGGAVSGNTLGVKSFDGGLERGGFEMAGHRREG